MDVSYSTAKLLGQSVSGSRGTTPGVTTGEVLRVDSDGTVWVKVEGSDTETPMSATNVGCRAGDTVDVRITHEEALVTGNRTCPATDDALAERANAFAQRASDAAYEAGDVANSAFARASEASGLANSAYDRASEASDIANAASTVVEGMADRVQEAVDNAAEAQDLAVQAENAAEAARDLAVQAGELTDAANEAADRALGVADDAVHRSVAAENTINSLNVRIGEGDDQSLIRAYGDGVLVGRVNQQTCAVVSAGDSDTPSSFDIVDSRWIGQDYEEQVQVVNEDTGEVETQTVERTRLVPDVREAIASFGERTVIGRRDDPHVEIDPEGMTLFGKQDGGLKDTARLAGDTLVASNAEIERYMVLGAWRLYPRRDGNLTLKWVG